MMLSFFYNFFIAHLIFLMYKYPKSRMVMHMKPKLVNKPMSVYTEKTSAASLYTLMYGLRMSKWKAGVSRRRFRAHFSPLAMRRPSPSQARNIR